MIIELRGVEFVNKGAELMFHAIVDQFNKRNIHVTFVMEVTDRSPFSKIRSEGVYAKSNIQRKGIQWNPVLSMLPISLRRKLGFVADHEIQVVMDASGFAFGDKWGAAKAGKRAANFIKKWKKDGKQVILLPQAFGPFSKLDLSAKMKTILENADLVCARDAVSESYLKELKVKNAPIFLFPDFTNMVKGTFPSSIKKDILELVIIPNQKMMETGNQEDNTWYPIFLQKVIEIAQQKGIMPVFLIHESKMDAAIAKLVNDSLLKPIPVIHEENALHVKGIIGESKAVITSRFHGLVSALSQGVPCLATGWSHKYEMLFKDYEYEEGLCLLHQSDDYYQEKLTSILDPEKAESVRKKLVARSTEEKKRTEGMWNMVFGLLSHIQKK
ncbi:polysaccharide pyruvyl transferase family protein [Mongoliitalea lutea]|uniref:Polysaccharide pyruvyl transferase domain-containing protein n=1 Tax=Mongoliitalea lutea TaxID=849756 RepID=A0A8J3CUM6_9BACT|nr:polysaccharide pyruvyl transferase family protein [Mongoliitalea lutea]GHB31521.1 hypothetical protein GCM10008106_10430 [Mongoliitalea lutea]